MPSPHLSGFERAMVALDGAGVPRENGTGKLSLPQRIVLLAGGQIVPPLMGVREAADCLGVATGNLSRVSGLPEPVAHLACGSIYLASEVEAVAARRRR